MEIKKLVCAIIYILLSICNGLSRWYVKQHNVIVPEEYSLLPFCASVLPYLSYKLNYKSKLFVFIFIQIFALLYVYIFESSSVIYFFYSLIDFSNMILRYHLYWKYIVYNTLLLEETAGFHIYASCSYFSFHIEYQIDRLMKHISIDQDFVLYGCCVMYAIIGATVLRLYNVDEKHILVHDIVNKRRAFIKLMCVYFSECIMLGILKIYCTQCSGSHIATIIGSFLILTLNGKLLKLFQYDKLIYVSGTISLIVLLCMKFANIYKEYIIRAGIALITGSKLIIFDSLHQILHITHKKNVIDRYVGLEIIALSLAYVTIYYIQQMYIFYFSIFCCIGLLISETFTVKYYKKDQDFLECISQLDEF